MKKIISAILMAIMLVQLMPAVMASAEGEKPYTLADAYYIMDEYLVANGSYPEKGNPQGAPSGWDGHFMAGKILNGWGTFYMEDTNGYLGLDMKKKFEVQDGKEALTLETYFRFDTYMNDLKFSMRSESEDIVHFITRGGNMYAKTAADEKLIISSCREGYIYGLKAIVNQKAKSVTVYTSINSAPVTLSMGDKTAIDNYYMETGVEATGKVSIWRVMMYYDYFVHDWFITNVENSFQTKAAAPVVYNDWSVEGTVDLVKVVSPRDSQGLKVGENSTVTKVYNKSADITGYEFKFIQPEKADGFSMDLGGEAKLITENGNICYVNPNGVKTAVYNNYYANVWYFVKVIAFKNLGVCDLYINGRLITENLPISNNNGQISFSSGEKSVTLDEIMVFPRIPEPEDYVETPVPVQSDRAVGMQSCSLWQEGQQFGWETINMHEDRTPYLGFYDEPKPEVADWEIKWMSEHGITFQHYCWFRPGGGDGTPIKMPESTRALHDGFMGAKYSNYLKYSIMFENANSGFSGMDDFKQNIVPFWIEHYFKDSRYMVLDNKPVVSFFSLSKLIDQMGGTTALVKEGLDYVREECRKIGFDGTIFMICGGVSNINDIAACGFDCMYAYNWGSSGGNVSTQQIGMNQRLDQGIDFVPTPTIGWNDLAWGGNGGSVLSVDDFRTINKWAKTDYVPRATGEYAKKMVMIGNWNEFGEGHYISPSTLSGFDYLDVIKEVWAGGGAHEDKVPTANQKARINKLYDQTRNPVYIGNSENVSDYPTEVAYEWDFSGGLSGWTKLTNIQEVTAADGAMKIVSSGTDPNVQSAKNLGIDISDVTYIKIRMKNCTAAAYSQFFYITTAHTGSWTETGASCSTWYPSSNDTEFHDYYIKVEGKGEWKGKLNQIRFDPFDGIKGGECYVESIQLLKDSKITDNKIAYNGKDYKTAPTIKDGSMYVPAERILDIMGHKNEWYEDEKKLVVVSGGDLTEIKVDEKTINRNFKNIAVDGAAYIDEEGQVMLSADILRKAFDCAISTDTENNIMTIMTGKMEWYFKDAGLDGWSLSRNFSFPVITGKYLRLKANGYDAAIFSDPNVNLAGGSIKEFKIKFKNETPASYAKLYYMPAKTEQCSDENCAVFEIIPNDTEFTEYTIPVEISDTIKQIKVVLTNAEGNVEIEYIRAGI